MNHFSDIGEDELSAQPGYMRLIAAAMTPHQARLMVAELMHIHGTDNMRTLLVSPDTARRAIREEGGVTIFGGQEVPEDLREDLLGQLGTNAWREVNDRDLVSALDRIENSIAGEAAQLKHDWESSANAYQVWMMVSDADGAREHKIKTGAFASGMDAVRWAKHAVGKTAEEAVSSLEEHGHLSSGEEVIGAAVDVYDTDFDFVIGEIRFGEI